MPVPMPTTTPHSNINCQTFVIASDTTKQLMTQLSRNRLKESLDGVPQQIDDVQARLAKAASSADKERYTDLIRQLKAYQIEMKSFTLELPTITFAKTHVIKDAAGDLHIEFHGRAHTAGDIAVFSPQKRVVASGDAIIGFLPNIADGYPRAWPATIDSVGQLAFDHIIPGHGAVHHDRAHAQDKYASKPRCIPWVARTVQRNACRTSAGGGTPWVCAQPVARA
jgi:glyoxylase-like metal-dependent hydrolase (beta-lactamase superfamily II)